MGSGWKRGRHRAINKDDVGQTVIITTRHPESGTEERLTPHEMGNNARVNVASDSIYR